MRAQSFNAREKSLPVVLLLLGFCGGIAFADIAGSSGCGIHQLTTATYVLYSSPTMDQAPVEPREGSMVCLSCHDGTTAIDSYGPRTGVGLMTGPATIGTDLSDDHPVSVYCNH